MSADAARAASAAPVDRPAGAGLVLAPFHAYRYDTSIVGSLGAALAPPYDVISSADAAALHARSGYNASSLNRPASYPAAAEMLRSWISEGALKRDRSAGLYAYAQVLADGTRVRGLLGALALRQPATAVVLPHEDTQPGPVSDRLALMTTTGADLEPILLVYDGGPTVSAAVDAALGGSLLAEVVTPDGVGHLLAAITEPSRLGAIATELAPRQALIADGHHRYAAYLRRQVVAHERGSGPGPWDFGLTLLVDGSQAGLAVRAIHRVIADLPLADAVASAAGAGRVTPLHPGTPAGWLAKLVATPAPAFVLAAGDHAYLLEGVVPARGRRPAPRAGSVTPPGGQALSELAVTVLADQLLPLVLGRSEAEAVDIADPSVAVARAAQLGGTAILLPPITFHDVLRVAAAGERMPRKSTLFLPKPVSGLTFRVLED